MQISNPSKQHKSNTPLFPPSLSKEPGDNHQEGPAMEEVLEIVGLVHMHSLSELSNIMDTQREIVWASIPQDQAQAVVPLLSPLFRIDLCGFLKSLPLRMTGEILTNSEPTPNFPKYLVCCLACLEKLIFQNRLSEACAPEILSDIGFTKQLFDLLLLILCNGIQKLFQITEPPSSSSSSSSPFFFGTTKSSWWECTGAAFWILNRLHTQEISGYALLTQFHSFLYSFLVHPKLHLFVEAALDVWTVATHELFVSNSRLLKSCRESVMDCVLHAIDSLFWMCLSTDLMKQLLEGEGSQNPTPLIADLPLRAVSLVHSALCWSVGELGRIRPGQKKLISQAVRLMIVFVEKDDPYFLDFVADQCIDQMKKLLQFLCKICERLVEGHLGDILLTLCVQLLELCCDDSNFKSFLAEQCVTWVLKFLSARPKAILGVLSMPSLERTTIHYIVRVVSNLHCFNNELCAHTDRNRFSTLCYKRCVLAFEEMGGGQDEEIFPAFVSQNLNAILSDFREWKMGESWENPHVSEEDIALLSDFIFTLARRFSRSGRKNILETSFSQSLLLSLPRTTHHEHSESLLTEGQEGVFLEGASMANCTVASLQYWKASQQSSEECQLFSRMLFSLEATLRRRREPSSSSSSSSPLCFPSSLSFPLGSVYEDIQQTTHHRMIIGPPAMAHPIQIIKPQNPSQSENALLQKKRKSHEQGQRNEKKKKIRKRSFGKS